MNSRRRIATEIELLKELQQLDGNEASRLLMERHLRDSIIYFTSSREVTREMRKILIFGSFLVIGVFVGLGGYIALSVSDLGSLKWIAQLVMISGWAGVAAPNAIYLALAVRDDRRQQKKISNAAAVPDESASDG